MFARNCDLCLLAISISRLFSSISLNKRAFWIASTDCAAKVWRRSMVDLGNKPGSRRRTTRAPMMRFGRRIGNLHGFPPLGCPSDVGFSGADGLLADRLNQLFTHAVGGAKSELLAQLAEDVDRARVGSRELNRLRHD